MTALVGGARVDLSGDRIAEVVEDGVTRAVAAYPVVRSMAVAERAAILDRVAARLHAARDEVAVELSREAGFLTVRDMALEVERTVEVFTMMAAAVREGFDEVVNVAASARGEGTLAIVRRVPYGPVLAITAFNGPILIAAHKLAPAIAAGASVVLKPSPRVPGAALRLAEFVIDAGWPADALAVLPVDNEWTMALVRDPRLPAISFTGGDAGWELKAAAPRKHVHLELGGVGAVIVASDAEVPLAAAECVAGGFVRSGQACLAVQRIYAHEDIYDDLVGLMREYVARVHTGDPLDPRTTVGPMVDEDAAKRVTELIDDAVERGAVAHVGGGVAGGREVAPTLLADATSEMAVLRTEAFGPVIAVSRFSDIEDAMREANSCGGALNAGVFTRDIDLALSLADRLEAGSVIINGSNAWRVDNMPFGGVGSAGVGREGVRYMFEELTQRKTIVIRRSV